MSKPSRVRRIATTAQVRRDERPTPENTSEYTINVPVVKASHRVRVQFESFEAVQYEFYIPNQILEHEAVRQFLEWLEEYERNATVLPDLIGLFKPYPPERTTVYRKIVRKSKAQVSVARKFIENRVGRLMADLSVNPNAVQKEIWFTETMINVSRSFNLKPI